MWLEVGRLGDCGPQFIFCATAGILLVSKIHSDVGDEVDVQSLRLPFVIFSMLARDFFLDLDWIMLRAISVHCNFSVWIKKRDRLMEAHIQSTKLVVEHRDVLRGNARI